MYPSISRALQDGIVIFGFVKCVCVWFCFQTCVCMVWNLVFSCFSVLELHLPVGYLFMSTKQDDYTIFLSQLSVVEV